MQKIFRVNMGEGYVKDFTDENEANACEAEIKLQKEKEEAERKAREEKYKNLVQFKSKKLKEVNDAISNLGKLIDGYEKDYGKKLYLTREYCSGNLVAKETTNTIDLAWDNWDKVIEDLAKMLKAE